MCWEWVEEKKHSGYIYLMLDNEDDNGVSIYAEFTNDPEQISIWICLSYAIWQAYGYENEIMYHNLLRYAMKVSLQSLCKK